MKKAVSNILLNSGVYLAQGGPPINNVTVPPSLPTTIPLPTGIFNPVLPNFIGKAANVLAGSIISSFVGLALIVAGFACLFFLILGGLQWITSGGDKAGVEAAREKILAAIIGLFIVVSSWVIFSFIADFLGLSFPNIILPTLGD